MRVGDRRAAAGVTHPRMLVKVISGIAKVGRKRPRSAVIAASVDQPLEFRRIGHGRVIFDRHAFRGRVRVGLCYAVRLAEPFLHSEMIEFFEEATDLKCRAYHISPVALRMTASLWHFPGRYFQVRTPVAPAPSIRWAITRLLVVVH